MSEITMPFRSDVKDAVLVVIDMQEKLVPAMHNAGALVSNTTKLIRGCVLLGLPVIFTQQYTKGLGETIPQIKDVYTPDLMNSGANVLLAGEDPIVKPHEQAEFSYIEKTSFSIMYEPSFVSALRGMARREVIVCGIEAHVCVMQSALDLVERGYYVRVIADATASRHSPDAQYAHLRMERVGATLTTTEALLFDLMKDASHPAFKQISALVK